MLTHRLIHHLILHHTYRPTRAPSLLSTFVYQHMALSPKPMLPKGEGADMNDVQDVDSQIDSGLNAPNANSGTANAASSASSSPSVSTASESTLRAVNIVPRIASGSPRDTRPVMHMGETSDEAPGETLCETSDETPPTSPSLPSSCISSQCPTPQSDRPPTSLYHATSPSRSRSRSRSRSQSSLALHVLPGTVLRRPDPIMSPLKWPSSSIPKKKSSIPDTWHPDECRGNWAGVNMGRQCCPVFARFGVCTCHWCGRLLQIPGPPMNGLPRTSREHDDWVRDEAERARASSGNGGVLSGEGEEESEPDSVSVRSHASCESIT
ncbi:hypothetical protein CC85DRAFT_6125 [Cutaneotrichosporon oleaginosum]|uniref:Uncharacterized protein n=1 Tax=Cutaneotrichosporon oleaginosum TaxID=879819 RepID=A0A0J1BEM2_9TREE|nr:uncharacterized protein CC85DRAFT_6125 [Cutaneotrichosporon oleaginosum]KLT46569.1 hypothetical protein CC85DRAFT_6125 [Cutaneotrichosporon oleaginosum]TXT15066.1 hypothetical protein COLE_01259 [Cutaneotrichosporon oleaginosum]